MFTIKAILMLMLPFYRSSLTGLLYGNEMSYTEYKYGVATSSIHLKFEDTTYVKLRSLLDKEKEGWKYDLVTYAPSHVYSSQYVRINCINKKIVVNYQKNGDWVQVSKEIVESCPTPP